MFVITANSGTFRKNRNVKLNKPRTSLGKGIKLGKYLIIKKKPNCNEFIIINKKSAFIGDIAWNKKWKKFAFYPDEGAVEHDIYLCSMCMEEIADYLRILNLERPRIEVALADQKGKYID